MNPIGEIATAIGKAFEVSRPSYGGGGWGTMLSGLTGGPPANRVQMMQSYSTVGWLFRSISLISEAVASADWSLYKKNSNGDREEIFDHPFLDLWKAPNPYMTHEVFMESQQQHIELTGESYWLILPNAGGFPAELWPLRPDTVDPIRDPNKFISGYLYRTGRERVRLPPELVICVKQPSPLDVYRGVGIVQALFSDLDSERLAALYNRNFFNNSAEPGGVIQFEQELSPAEFDRIQRHWGSLHRGVNNAHRVAVLERGEWKERKNTQRDMQFEQGRRLARDLIAGAFGIPLTMLGVSENVNRANAEAGEVVFSRWVVKTKLRRIRGAANTKLLPWYGDPSLVLDYADPTPEDKEFNLSEAERGYRGRFLTRNEARARVGEGEVDGGDEFDEAASPFTLSYEGGVIKSPTIDKSPIKKELTPSQQQQQKIQRNWTKRLRTESKAIIEHLGQFLKSGRREIAQKIELGDVDTYDWDWFERYGDDVTAELAEAYEIALIEGLPDVSDDVAKRLSMAYAEQRTSLLLLGHGKGFASITEFARTRVNILVAETIRTGESLNTLKKKLESDIGFTSEKAEQIARTESATALGQGSKEAAVEDGSDEKRWMTQRDFLVSEDVCRPNGKAGWIPIGDAFPCSTTGGKNHTGHDDHDTIPGHPNCRCSVIYRTSWERVQPVDERSMLRIECATCHKLLDKVETPARFIETIPKRWCPRCKERRETRQVKNEVDY